MNVKKSIYTVCLSIVTLVEVHAQAVESVAKEGHWLTWVLENFVLLLGLAVILGSMVTLGRLFQDIMYTYRRSINPELYVEKESATEQTNIFQRAYNWAWSIVPVQKESDILLEHAHDGIYELDNKLPPWWLYGFYLSILFAVGYIYYYHYSDHATNMEIEYATEMRNAEIARRAYLRGQANLVDESNVTALDGKALAQGRVIFSVNCASCHGVDGGGGVGPNLTDEYWLHGGGIANVFKRIKYGVPQKGMIAWKAQLSPSDIQKVASYIMSIQGSTPANAKGPQGSKYVSENPDLDEKDLSYQE